jgi:hypothetical protein
LGVLMDSMTAMTCSKAIGRTLWPGRGVNMSVCPGWPLSGR